MNRFQPVLDRQRAFFFSGASRALAWRLDQLDRMERLLRENQQTLSEALYQDFRKPPFEQLFEITVPLGVIAYYRKNLAALMAPRPVAIPKGLEATGNRGVIHKEPYGVTPGHRPVQCAHPAAARPRRRRAGGWQHRGAQACQHHAARGCATG